MIDRLDDAKDRRIRHLQLTDKGRSLIQSRYTKRTENARRMIEGLGCEQSQKLMDALTKLESVCKQITAKDSPTHEVLASAMHEELPS